MSLERRNTSDEIQPQIKPVSVELVRFNTNKFRTENTGDPDVEFELRFHTLQVRLLRQALKRGEIRAEEFDTMLGTMLTEKTLLSDRDSLTGLYNRRGMSRRSEEVVAQAQRQKVGVAIAMADLDGFKQRQDALGRHAFGDGVLKATADALNVTTRKGDLAGRWGGDEFILLMAGIDHAGAKTMLSRLHADVPQRISASASQQGFNLESPITVSIGYTHTNLPNIESISNMIVTADAALYTAKNQGRNRIVGGSLPTEL